MAVEGSRAPLQVVRSAATPDPDDATLARALMAGEDWAIAATWNRFAPVVHGIASRALGRDVEAEDVTQEVFYRLFSRIRTLKDPAAFRSFVVSFALRIVKWELRRRRVRRWVLSDSGQLPEMPIGDGDHESREVLRKFYVVLDQLPPRERLVFALRHLEAMTLEEVATAMGISLATVKRTLVRATARVAGWIDADRDLARFFDGKRGNP